MASTPTIRRMIAVEQLEAVRALGKLEARIVDALEEAGSWAWNLDGSVSWQRIGKRLRVSKARLLEARDRMAAVARSIL